MSKFLSTYHVKKIVKQKNCFKNSDRPTCTDLIMTLTLLEASKILVP